MIPADQIGVLALPAQPGGLPQRLFHYRRCIDEHLHANCAEPAFSGLCHQPAGQRFFGLLDRVVIVAALRIDRYPGPVGRTGQSQWIGSGRIAHPQRDHAAGLVPQPLRAAAVVEPVGHPAHFAMCAFAQPLLQPGSGQRVFGRRGDRAGGKAQPPGFGDQVLLEICDGGGVNQTCCCSCSEALHSGLEP